MGLAFKPNIDDLRESPAKSISRTAVSSITDIKFLVVEPNIPSFPDFTLTDYKDAYNKADIIAYLVAHNEFKTLPHNNNKVVLDFCGIFK